MKKGLYSRLAFDGIRKNKKMYLPYLLTCIGMVMMLYIMVYLTGQSKNIVSDPYASGVSLVLNYGVWVIALFSVIFLFYTNSFLMKRRKKEFGLYNILGMDKGNLGKLLFFETLIVAAISIGAGILAGIIFSKLFELFAIALVNGEINYRLSISVDGILMCLATFSVIFLLLFLNSFRQLKFSNAISLFKSENAGEKPPKSNWFFGMLGVLILAAAYYIALTIKNPYEAMSQFFIAVLMVIVATFLIMISGSVTLCRLLQKNKKYYYKSKHFISVSSMKYRMKRNGAGLASICILATMVLVMISSTACLYFGIEDTVNFQCPVDISFQMSSLNSDIIDEGYFEPLKKDIDNTVKKYMVQPKDAVEYSYGYTVAILGDGTLYLDGSKLRQSYNVYEVNIISVRDYNRLMGTSYELSNSEAMIYFSDKDYVYDRDTISFEKGKSFKVVKQLDECIKQSGSLISTGNIFFIVNDIKDATVGIIKTDLTSKTSGNIVNFAWKYCFDVDLDSDKQIQLAEEIDSLLDENHKQYDCFQSSIRSKADSYISSGALYGGLFCLGIILSIIFIFAAVLIIYYKQISEGYEDQARFNIMQKVGMTKKEIRKSINSQLLTVFFLPLIFAIMHLGFAFPLIKKILIMFGLNNFTLFTITTVISAAVFALLYTVVYKITSNAYYKIVSGTKEE